MTRIHFRSVAILCVAAAAIITPAALAQPCPQILEDPYQGVAGVNGGLDTISVSASVEWDPDGAGPLSPWLVVGGKFANAGRLTSPFNADINIAAWDGEHWHSLGAGLGTAGAAPAVRSLVVYNGQLIAAGNRLRIDGAAVNDVGAVARFNGTTWEAMGTVFQLGVGEDIAIVNGELVLVLSNSSASSTWRYIARWTGTDWTPFSPSLAFPGALPVERIVEFEGGPVIVDNANRIQRIVAGAWQVMATIHVDVRDLAVFNGQLYAATSSETGVQRWNGASFDPVGPASAGGVNTLRVIDGFLYAGGQFNTAAAIGAREIARFDGTTWSKLNSAQGILPATGLDIVDCIAPYGHELVIGGRFTTVAALGFSNVTRWNGESWLPLAEGVCPGVVTDALVHNDRLVLAGSFSAAGLLRARSVVTWDGAHYLPLGSGVNGARTLGSYQGCLVAGGTGGVSTWTGHSWIALGATPGSVSALADFQGTLFAGRVAGGIRRWDGFVWQTVPGAPAGAINDLEVHGGSLFASHAASVVNGISCVISRFDGAQWLPANATDVSAKKLLSLNGSLFASVQHATTILAVVRFDDPVWTDVPGSKGVVVRGLAGYRGQLCAARNGGVVAFVDGLVQPLNGTGVLAGSSVIAQFKDELFVASDTGELTRFSETGVPFIVLQPEDTSIGCNPDVQFSATHAAGYSGLSFVWQREQTPGAGDFVNLADGPSLSGAAITGATTLELRINPAAALDQGAYRVRVYSACGEVFSESAQLIDHGCPCSVADLTGVGGPPSVPDNQLTVDDIVAFVNSFSDATGCPGATPCNLADITSVGGPPSPADGELTVDDVISFFNAFADGC